MSLLPFVLCLTSLCRAGLAEVPKPNQLPVAAAQPLAAQANPQTEELPPVDLGRQGRSAPSPQFDLGFSLGVCGIGKQQLWQATEFCAGLTSDLLFFRRTPRAVGLGPFLALDTSGFQDARTSLGLLAAVPVSELLALQARAAPTVLISNEGTA